MARASLAMRSASGRGIVFRARKVRVRARTSSICRPSRSSARRASVPWPAAHDVAPSSTVSAACSSFATNVGWSGPRSLEERTSASSASTPQPIHSKLGSTPHADGSVVVVVLLVVTVDVETVVELVLLVVVVGRTVVEVVLVVE